MNEVKIQQQDLQKSLLESSQSFLHTKGDTSEESIEEAVRFFSGNPYFSKLNEEQIGVLTEMIHEIKVGDQVLHEDIIQLSDIATNCPMVGCSKIKLAGQPETRFRAVRLPEKLAEVTEPEDEYQANEFLIINI